tara:strand:- start:343 stop:714 length:372 start_codon:yes stop_codon:yes gene_type:complete
MKTLLTLITLISSVILTGCNSSPAADSIEAAKAEQEAAILAASQEFINFVNEKAIAGVRAQNIVMQCTGSKMGLITLDHLYNKKCYMAVQGMDSRYHMDSFPEAAKHHKVLASNQGENIFVPM